MRGVWAFAIVLSLIVGPAWAGSELSPEIDDSPDQQDPTLDLLSAWFESAPSGVEFTVKIGEIDANTTDHLYFVRFDLNDSEHLAAVMVNGSATLSYLGESGPGTRGQTPEAIANGALGSVSVRTGTPAYVSAIIPTGAVAGLVPGAQLLNLTAGASEYQRARSRWADVDFRETNATFTFERTFVPTFVTTRGVIIATGLALFFAAGALAAWWILRRRDRSPRAPIAPPAEAPDAARSRFELRPGRR